MKRFAILVAVSGLLAATGLSAQERQEGTWTGTHQRTDGNNRPVQKISIEIKKSPDPHWAWRQGAADVWSVTLVGPPVGRAQVGDLRIEAGAMSFYYMRQDLRYDCRLQQQPTDAFTGRCVADGTNQIFNITLNPPVATAKH